MKSLLSENIIKITDAKNLAKPSNFRRAFAAFLTTYITSFSVDHLEEENSLLARQPREKSVWKLIMTTANGTRLDFSGIWNMTTGSSVRVNGTELMKSTDSNEIIYSDSGLGILKTAF